MRIGWKLALALVLPLVALTLLLGYAFQLRSRALLRDELAREGRAIARVVEIASEDYLRDRQIADLRELADRISGYERVFGVRLFDAQGELTYQPDTLSQLPFQHRQELRTALTERRLVEMRRAIGANNAIGFIVPLLNHRQELVGAVQVLQLESYIDEDDRATRAFVLQLTLAVVLATVGIVLLVTRVSIARPIERLVRSFRETGSRETPAPVPVRGDDELSWLSREFNHMCERLQRARENLHLEQDQRREVESRLRTAERLASLGHMAAGLAHEIGTPLNVILGRAESLQRSLAGQEPAERHLGTIVTQSERIARTVRDMLDFARTRPREHVPTDVRGALAIARDLLEERCERQQVSVEQSLPEHLPRVLADPDQLQQVFLNLIVNALDAMPDGGRLRLSVAEVTAAPAETPDRTGRFLQLVVEDSGGGIAREDLDRVFDPFFTTKDPGGGTGLGLAVSYAIVREHGGWFQVRSRVEEGSRFEVFLPVHDGAGRTS